MRALDHTPPARARHALIMVLCIPRGRCVVRPHSLSFCADEAGAAQKLKITKRSHLRVTAQFLHQAIFRLDGAINRVSTGVQGRTQPGRHRYQDGFEWLQTVRWAHPRASYGALHASRGTLHASAGGWCTQRMAALRLAMPPNSRWSAPRSLRGTAAPRSRGPGPPGVRCIAGCRWGRRRRRRAYRRHRGRT